MFKFEINGNMLLYTHSKGKQPRRRCRSFYIYPTYLKTNSLQEYSSNYKLTNLFAFHWINTRNYISNKSNSVIRFKGIFKRIIIVRILTSKFLSKRFRLSHSSNKWCGGVQSTLQYWWMSKTYSYSCTFKAKEIRYLKRNYFFPLN